LFFAILPRNSLCRFHCEPGPVTFLLFPLIANDMFVISQSARCGYQLVLRVKATGAILGQSPMDDGSFTIIEMFVGIIKTTQREFVTKMSGAFEGNFHRFICIIKLNLENSNGILLRPSRTRELEE